MQFGFVVQEAPGERYPVAWKRAGVKVITTPAGRSFPQHYPQKGQDAAKQNIAKHALVAMRQNGIKGATEEPVKVLLVFFFPKPKARQGKYSDKFPFPNVKPDIDNHTKLVLDAISNVVYRDDTAVVSVTAHQRYVIDGPAHTFIGVRTLEDWEAQNPLAMEGSTCEGFQQFYPKLGLGF